MTPGEGDRLEMKDRPLNGLRVLDFGHTVMGPTCGMVLGDLGADVVRVEPPGGDRTRFMKGFALGFFETFNRNKRSLVVDLKSRRGLDVAKKLVESADILIENFAPGVMDRLGLGWSDLEPINPRLIYCSLKGYLPGPYEDLPALDEVVQMQTGLAYMTGPPGRPLRAGASIIDILGGVFGVVGILAALRERDRTGRGGVVQSALFESAVFLMGPHMTTSAMGGSPPLPMPARVSAWPVYDIYQTADAPVFVGVTSDRHWEQLCRTLDLPDLRHDPRLANHEDRVRNRDVIAVRLQAVLSTRNRAEILDLLRAAKIPAAPVAAPDELLQDEHLGRSGGLVSTRAADGAMVGIPRTPIQFDSRALGLAKQPPAVGADTRDVLREAGLSDPEIAALEADRIVEAGQDGDEHPVLGGGS